MKAASQSREPSIVDEGEPMPPPAEKAPSDDTLQARITRPDAKAMPAFASEGPNGAPSNGPNPEHGMTAVVDNTVERADENETVRMVHVDGHEVDVGVADVKAHERAGWKRT